MTAIRKLHIPDDDVETYRGLLVLHLRVGDPIPTPPIPMRYAVRVGPDLARYLLTFNIDHNRKATPRNWMKLATDMAADRYILQPQGPIFDTLGRLGNGQHTLLGVIDAAGIRPGTQVWVVMDFGWPPETFAVIDRGRGRTGADTLTFATVANASIVASAIVGEWQLRQLIGTSRSIVSFPVPSQPEMQAIYEEDPEGWQASARVAKSVYSRLQKGGSVKGWAAIHYLLARRIDREIADRFMEEVGGGTGQPGSATRELGTYYVRRPYGDRSKTGDRREFYEIVLRAFNAWRTNKPLRFPRTVEVLTVPR